MKKQWFRWIVPIFFFTGIISLSLSLASCDPKEDDPDDSMPVVYKPNIYLYPAGTMQLSLQIEFPAGGKIEKSIPEYLQGWNVNVDSNGRIDGTYDYLFYESSQPDVWQHDQGWLVKKGDLRPFFVKNMGQYGFSFREIKDFVEYWIPRLQDHEWYALYPQDAQLIGSVIRFKWSQAPDHLLRLFYLVEGVDDPSQYKLIEPATPQTFERSGFHATEWGVVLR
jgi:hypothetical protein